MDFSKPVDIELNGATSTWRFAPSLRSFAETLARRVDPAFAFSAQFPTASGWVSMDTFQSSYDTILAVWSGNRGALSLVACNNNYPTYTSSVDANLVAGTR